MEKEGRISIDVSAWIVHYLLDEINEDEQKALDIWLAGSEEHRFLFQEICENRTEFIQHFGKSGWEPERAFQRFLHKRRALEGSRGIRLSVVLQYAALWGLLIMVAGGLLWKYYTPQPVTQTWVLADTANHYFGNKPTLTLADGKEIIVDKGNSNLSHLQGVQMRGQDSNELIYAGTLATNDRLEYHVLRTPSQCDYHFVLSDGSKVWLNAASSIRYPIAFGNNERVIYTSGEIYLQVAKDPTRPFYVVTDNLKVEVLGTSFNVHAYGEENYTAITLVEGKVAAYTGKDVYQLVPDRQLYVNHQEQQVEIRQVNVNDYISWKEGKYIFKRQTLAEVAKVLERWYDIQVLFENINIKNDIYTGIVYKEENVSAFVQRLNSSADYHCRVENNVIYIR